MNVTQKKTIAKYLTVTLVFLLVGIGIGYTINPLVAHRNPSIVANVEITENIGGVTAQLYSGNVITDIGETYIRNIIGFDNETGHNATKWISLSNDASPADTWTQLASESTTNNFTRALGTVTAWINSGDSAYNVTYTFTASGTETLQCAGLQWSGVSASDNNLFACAAFTQTTFNAADTLTITWSITVNAND